MLALDLTNNSRHVVTAQELKKQLNGLAIATDCLLRAVACSKATAPAFEILVDPRHLLHQRVLLPLGPLAATETDIRAVPDVTPALLAGLGALCAVLIDLDYTIHPDRWHFVGADGLEPPTCSL